MMRNLTFTIFFLLPTTLLCAQNNLGKSKGLNETEITKVFADSVKKQLNFIYPISKVYECADQSGKFYIVLTESIIGINSSEIHRNIRAYKVSKAKNALTIKWMLNDFITKQGTNDDMEHSIWFWNKYCLFEDLDNDGLTDPILVYGTSGSNYTSDGRIKILIYYKDKKVAIRHQNGMLDFERNTTVDQAFYGLPVEIQNRTKLLMKKMTDENTAIFPHCWETAMKKRKVYFDEN